MTDLGPDQRTLRAVHLERSRGSGCQCWRLFGYNPAELHLGLGINGPALSNAALFLRGHRVSIQQQEEKSSWYSSAKWPKSALEEALSYDKTMLMLEAATSTLI